MLGVDVLQSSRQSIGELCQALASDFLESAPESWIPGGVKRELKIEKEEVQIGVKRAVDGRGRGKQRFGSVAASGRSFGQLTSAPLHALLVQAQEQVLLAREVRIQRPGRQPRRLRDRFY